MHLRSYGHFGLQRYYFYFIYPNAAFLKSPFDVSFYENITIKNTLYTLSLFIFLLTDIVLPLE